MGRGEEWALWNRRARAGRGAAHMHKHALWHAHDEALTPADVPARRCSQLGARASCAGQATARPVEQPIPSRHGCRECCGTGDSPPGCLTGPHNAHHLPAL